MIHLHKRWTILLRFFVVDVDQIQNKKMFKIKKSFPVGLGRRVSHGLWIVVLYLL